MTVSGARFRLLTYNILRGGVGREALLIDVINLVNPDLVLLQEATSPSVVARLAVGTGLATWGAHPRRSLAFLSRAPVAHHQWRRPRFSRHAFLEVVPNESLPRFFGLHLSAIHAAWTERRRLFELDALLKSIAHHQAGFHVLAGDFNTLAPNEPLDIDRLPLRLRPFVWMSGGRIRWRTIQAVLDAGYADVYRALHDEGRPTFPTSHSHLRLDYVFVPSASTDRVISCDVVDHPLAKAASDHFPVVADFRRE